MKPTRAFLKVLAAVFLGACMASCINNDYDISKLSKKIEVFGNSLSVPIGTTTIYMDSIFNGSGIDTSMLSVKNGMYLFSYTGGFDLSGLTSTLDNFRLNSVEGVTNSITFLNATGKPIPYSFPTGNFTYTGSMVINLPSFSTELIDVDSMLLWNSVMKLSFETRNLAWDSRTTSASVTFTAVGKGAEYYIDGESKTSWTINLGETKDIEIRKLRVGQKNNSLTLSRVANISIRELGGLKANQAVQTYLDISATFPSVLNFSQVWGKVDYSMQGSIDPINFGAFGKLLEENNVLGLYNPTIQITTSGNLGIPFNVDLDISSYNSRTGQVRYLNNTNFVMEASESPELTKVNTFLMDKDYGTSELFKNNPDRILMSYSIQSDINSSENHFIGEENKIDMTWRMDVPLQFSNDLNISLGKTIDNPIGSLEKLGDQEDLSVALILNVKNRIPLNLKIKLVALDADSIELFTTESGTIAAASPINSTTGFASGYSTTDTEISLLPEQIVLLSSTNKFRIDFVVTSSLLSEFVTIQPSDYIEIKIGAKIVGGVILDMDSGSDSGDPGNFFIN